MIGFSRSAPTVNQVGSLGHRQPQHKAERRGRCERNRWQRMHANCRLSNLGSCALFIPNGHNKIFPYCTMHFVIFCVPLTYKQEALKGVVLHTNWVATVTATNNYCWWAPLYVRYLSNVYNNGHTVEMGWHTARNACIEGPSSVEKNISTSDIASGKTSPTSEA